MTNYAYTMNTGSLKNFLKKMPLVGLPEKVTTRYIYTLGFKSTNDRTIIPILRFIKFLDDSGTPTDYYKKYRDTSKSRIILGAALKEGYSELFKFYPDAERQSRETLQNFFRTHTGLGDVAVNSITDTFRALCSLANLESGKGERNGEEDEELEDEENKSSNKHSINVALKDGRKAKIIMPADVTQEEIKKIKDIIDACS